MRISTTGKDTCRSGPCPRQDENPGHWALRRGRISLPRQAYLVTCATASRQRFFNDFAAGCAAARCFENVGVLGDAHMMAWVLMPDHAHWLIQLGAKDSLSIVVNRLKSASARLSNRVLNRRGALWASAYHDHALRVEEELYDVARYIVSNPLRACLVKRTGDYTFWNTIWI